MDAVGGDLAALAEEHETISAVPVLNHIQPFVDLAADRKRVVSGKSVSVSVDLGGRGLIKNKRIDTMSSVPLKHEEYPLITTQSFINTTHIANISVKISSFVRHDKTK